MDLAVEGDGQRSLDGTHVSVAAAFEGNEEIAAARELARSSLGDVQAVHGLPVSGRAMGMVQLLVSELVTNARKYDHRPWLTRPGRHRDRVRATQRPRPLVRLGGGDAATAQAFQTSVLERREQATSSAVDLVAFGAELGDRGANERCAS